MRAIISGKRYDTDKAILIGHADYGYQGDFSRWEAGLYRTPRSGVFFLAGEGGPMTRWARTIDSSGTRSGGEGIFPMTREEARQWAEAYLTTEQVEAGFAADIVDA